MNKLYYVFVFALLSFAARAQVGINILIPDSSAVLQLESNKKGLGLSRLTTPQRDGIVNPLKGLTIFNTTDSLIEYWNGECWLKVYERNCWECGFTLSIDDDTDTLDRLVSDSVFSTISVKRTHGNQKITVVGIVALQTGITMHFNGATTVDSTNSLQIVIKADICSPSGGDFNVIIQAFCDGQIRFIPYKVHVIAPKQYTLSVDQVNYNVQVANGLPAGSSQFILLDIDRYVRLSSADAALPAFTTGNLNTNSIVCINNNGDVLGRGGDGGSFTFTGNLLVVGGESGKQGGDAMHLSSRTYLKNNGAIYAGGSGGGSVGFALGTPSIPIIGPITIGFGYCGGGGSELGKGGVISGGGSGISIGLFKNGGDATCCINSIPGAGPVDNYPISIPISVASINITPSAHGGDGGGYSQQGAPGYIDVTLDVCVSIPIIGNICIPIPIPGNLLPFNGPASFPPGVAIKRNSNALTGIPDGTYGTAQVKGAVVP